jgi:WS/DGAT/MGAT family acyltransferase
MAERHTRLSASDMSSLLAERGPIHVHVGGTVIVAGRPPPFERVLAHVDARLGLVPRFRQRVTKVPVGLANPVWSDDSRFDLSWHVRHTALPKPGTLTQLRDLVGRIMSEPLDFTRPLWQIYLIEGLEGKRHAYVSKTHHALVDGVSAVDVGTLLVDVAEDGTPMPVPDAPWEPDAPSPRMLVAGAASERLRAPLRAARTATRSALLTPRSTAQRVRRTAEGFATLAAGGPSAPQTFLNREIGRDRRVAFVSTELASLKAARGTGGATVNDVVLTIAAGGLRRFFERRGERIPNHIVALVPVSVRRADEDLELGNRLATILMKLPLGEADPRRRLELVSAEMTRLKASEQARAASLIIEATGFAPPTINRVLGGALSRPLTWNLVISNVPGPQMPLYMLGRRIKAIYPFVPLSPQGHALSIGLLSYDGAVNFGLVGDRDLLADLDAFASDLGAAIEEQLAAA